MENDEFVMQAVWLQRQQRRDPGPRRCLQTVALAAYPSSAMLLTPYFRYQGLAASSARLTLLMFSTPVVSSHLRKASSPFLAKMAMPSFQVARPQSTPLNLVPDSPASSSVSMKTGLETPADR